MPRTVCGCHPVSAVIWVMLLPFGVRSRAINSACLLERAAVTGEVTPADGEAAGLVPCFSADVLAARPTLLEGRVGWFFGLVLVGACLAAAGVLREFFVVMGVSGEPAAQARRCHQ